MADPTSTEDPDFTNAIAINRAYLTEEDPISLIEKVYQLWWRWADFHLYIVSPTLNPISPPIIHQAEKLPNSNDLEFVYPILDRGYMLSTSKGEEMFSAGLSMCKLYFTIEKMINMLMDRLKDKEGITKETEVQVAFGGHELAQRKAFESIINLSYNVVVTNFDPGLWGDKYLNSVKLWPSKNLGYPPGAPRDNYRQSFGPNQSLKK